MEYDLIRLPVNPSMLDIMKFSGSSALQALAWLSLPVVQALDISGYTSPYCSVASNTQLVGTCGNIASVSPLHGMVHTVAEGTPVLLFKQDH
jgi:hypothetical protein